MSDLIGQSLGRYHILEPLGEGGMATVYKAFDTRLETDVAVKVIRTENILPSVLERSLKRFEREAKSLARLTHPNIVKVTDYGEFEGKPYLVMPYLPGGTLKDRIKQGQIPWQEAVRLILPIAQALEYAHEHNIIHRDVKPSNILLTEKGQPMLTDFGVAKLFDMDATADLTGTGMGVGTPEYMAPEQWQGQVSVQTDVYALGVVLFEMVTGRKPYVADTPAALLLKQATEPLPRPKSFVAGMPDAVEKVLFKALAKSLKDRYKDMGLFSNTLEGLFAENPAAVRTLRQTAREETAVSGLKSETYSRAFRRWWGWGGAILMTAIGLALYFLFGSQISVHLSPMRTPTALFTPMAVNLLSSATAEKTSMPPTASPTATPTPLSGGGRLSYVCKDENKLWIEQTDVIGNQPSLITIPVTIVSQFTMWTWSPDGDKVLIQEEDENIGKYNAYVFHLNTKELSLISDNFLDSINLFDWSWSPNGEFLAFSSKRFTTHTTVNIIRPDGKDRTPLADGWSISWSPNGKWIGYRANGLSYVTLDGKEITQISEGTSVWRQTWSPSSNNIAYVMGDYDREQALHLYDVVAKKYVGQLANLGVSDYYGGGISWSPNERWIIFYRMDGIYIIDPLTKIETKIYPFTQNLKISNYAGEFGWSPDSQRIVVSIFDSVNRTTNLTIIDVESKEPIEFGEGYFPIWSPDGTMIAFYSDRDGTEAVYVANVDGTDLTKVSDGQYKCMYPNWVTWEK